MTAPRDHDEFPADAALWPADLSRREFLRFMGASMALAGIGGCVREPARFIVPTVKRPDSATAEVNSRYFTTAVPSEGYARGVLVRTFSGRPTKIEGNPDHPESLGATDVFTQAAILDLYDPDRSAGPRQSGRAATWTEFEDLWRERRSDFVAAHGKGIALLTEPSTSPTLLREVHRLLDTFPEALWFQHTALPRYDRDGVQADFDFAAADVIFLIDSDCFYQHPAAVRYGRALASRRRIEHGRIAPPRFYAIEPTPSVSGMLADFRLPASPSRIRVVLNAIATGGHEGLSAAERNFVVGLTGDLAQHGGRALAQVGGWCDESIHGWADAFNARFGAGLVRHSPAVRSDADPRGRGTLVDLVAAMEKGAVDTLIIAGGNPAYASPRDAAFAERLERIGLRIHLGPYQDETAAHCHWHLPESHFLETWSDLRAYGGAPTIQQPLVEPLNASRSAAEFLRLIATGSHAYAYDLVRETWRGDADAPAFESRWEAWLRRGVVDAPALEPSPARERAEFPRLDVVALDAPEIVLRPDPNILDGRHANNAWLQELPKPLTHLVWENAALVTERFALQHRLSNGDLIVCATGQGSVTAPIWVTPGQAESTITLSLGYGRTHAGAIGRTRGYDAYAIQAQRTPWAAVGVAVKKLGGRQELVSTRLHFSMEGRDLVRVLDPAHAGGEDGMPAVPPSLYPPWSRDRYAWGMLIDLSTCLGCNACVIACQAENNIPVVGREQVARGREMHWLRVDRYITEPGENPRFFPQPVPCMQCENAPCEVVCPVGATVHSSEGLNDMVYNRCVGTRYCSNNCPYKVRRFNFFDYRAAQDSPIYLQANPDVTIRSRGVMEKCTYCVQRINAARINADRENRAIREGEVLTACQQACPAEAIVFGNINDPASRVSRRKAEPSNYALLEELNTRPRTTYLPAIRHGVTNAPVHSANTG